MRPTLATCVALLPLLLPLAWAADTLKGVLRCMNHEDCLGANRECSFLRRYGVEAARVGKCVCRQGYVRSGDNYACVREVPAEAVVRETCQKDEDCRLGEICMSWRYDPAADPARKLRSGVSPVRGERHQLCIDAWVIQQHMAELDEPRTGGGLRSHRRDNFNADEYFFSGRRPPRVHQQYIGFAEDMMLILFLVCILATLVTVHRATCYRQFQEARRNTPLRHLLPIAEDRPPPYSNSLRGEEDVDGVPEVVCSSAGPKRASETPPPSYEEALYRNSVRLPASQTQTDPLTTRAVAVTMEDAPAPAPSLPSGPPTPTQPEAQAPPATPDFPSSPSTSGEAGQASGPEGAIKQEQEEEGEEEDEGKRQEKEQEEQEDEQEEQEEVRSLTKDLTCSVVVGPEPGSGPVIPV